MGKLWADKRTYWPLLLVILFAIGLRVWAINWGLPYLYHHDETYLELIILHIFKTGDLNPHHFDYGSVFFYLNALVYIPYYLVGWILGIFHNPGDIPYPTQLAMGVGYTPMQTTYLLGRGLTVLFGVACVYLVYLIGWRATGNRLVGLVAAFMTAISPTGIEISRSITTNVYLMFFILLTVWAALRIYQENSMGAYVLAGIAGGLVAGTKYNGVSVLLVVVVACLLREGWGAIRERRLYLAAGLTVLVFFITTPFAILDYQTFMADVRSQAVHYSTGHLGMEGDTVAWYLNFLWTHEGFVTVLGWLGILYAFLRRSQALIIVATFPIVYGVFISLFIVRNDRTILPLLPYLYILASVLIVDTGLWVLKRGLNLRVAAAAGALLVALLAVVPVSVASAWAISATQPDSRWTGVEWIKENIPAGSKVGIEVGSPWLDPTVYSVQPVGSVIAHSPDWYIQEHYDYLIFGADMFGRFYREPDKYANEVSQYDAFFKRFPLVRELDDGGYVVKIYKVPRQ